MIYINRCVDMKNGVVWVAGDLNEETRRVRGLYTGGDVNGAIKAAVDAGMDKDCAIVEAKRVLSRSLESLNDTIGV